MSERRQVKTPNGSIAYFADMSFPGRPTAVLLHGLSSNHTTWEDMVPVLKAAKINVIAWDQRGHGYSDMARKPFLYRMPVFADDLRRVLEAENVEKSLLLGYSYGGAVALEFAAAHPDRVQGMVLVSANHVSPIRIGFLSLAAYAALRVLGYLLIWQSRKRYYYYKHGDASGYVQSTLRGYATMPISVNFWMLSQMLILDYRKRLARIDLPVIIMRAEGDPFFSADEAKQMVAGLPNARLVTPRHASHFVASKSQDEIAELILSLT